MIKYKRIVHIPKLPEYAGDYEVKYDGLIISLYGRLKDNPNRELLIPVIEEVEGANPSIRYVDNDEIVVDIA